MAKVIFEFDDGNDEDDSINFITNRYKIRSALYDLQDLHRKLYNGKIYDADMVVVKDGKILTEDDYKKYQEMGEYPVKGTKHYIDYDYIERELDDILNDIRFLLDY